MVTCGLDEVIHAPTRLGIVALLAATDWAEFKFIRDSVGLSDSALSKQITTLETAGYVDVRKGYVGKRPRTWVRLSTGGRRAFDAYVAVLGDILHGQPTAPQAETPIEVGSPSRGDTRR